jgi:hypothetical protein
VVASNPVLAPDPGGAPSTKGERAVLIPPHVFCGPDADGVVTIRGEIDRSSLEDLTWRFASLPDPLLLDPSQVEYIDCSGLGILIAERCRRHRGIPLRIVATSHPPSIASWSSPE